MESSFRGIMRSATAGHVQVQRDPDYSPCQAVGGHRHCLISLKVIESKKRLNARVSGFGLNV